MSSEATAVGQFPALPPIRTSSSAAAAEAADDGGECATPTSEEHKIKAPLECPPAPRKPRPAADATRKRRRLRRRSRRVPRDLAATFDVALPPKKRIRVG